MSGATWHNHLAGESSPYLLQHAGNPVDWHPWGDEAFELARAEDKPIFLSIGYSTCHWCHVMARESFEDTEVAGILNASFVCIKVDREERPDIDQLYMNAAHLMIRSGGWPLTIIMTPDRMPFFAATYLPKTSTRGITGLLDLLPRITEMWGAQRGLVDGTAHKVAMVLRADSASPGSPLGLPALNACMAELSERYDAEHGGFGAAPKFPSPHTILFLLWRWRRSGDPHALRMAETTLKQMCRGGIHDHVGGGFHRYATDGAWVVPHFEKMLYDQAMLIMAYAEGYRATGTREFLSTAEGIAQYAIDVLRTPHGAFYAAEDADSVEGEGAYYTWTATEMQALLGDALWPLARDMYGIRPEGNYVDEVTGGTTGRNILHVARDIGDVAAMHGMDTGTCTDIVADINSTLARRRATRTRPHRDEKVLADWNGLMIAALSRFFVASGEAWSLEAARRCANFVLETLQEGGAVHHTIKGGGTRIAGTLDDYAFLAWGLLELYEASFDASYLDAASAIAEHLFARFWDKDAGGFFLASDGADDLIARQKVVYDGAIPSGNSVMLLVLSRGEGLFGPQGHPGAVDAMLSAFSPAVSAAPSAHTCFMMGVDTALGPCAQVAIIGTLHDGVDALVSAYRSVYVPHAVIAASAGGGGDAVPLLAHRPAAPAAKAHVCIGSTCMRPIGDPRELAVALEGLYDGATCHES